MAILHAYHAALMAKENVNLSLFAVGNVVQVSIEYCVWDMSTDSRVI